ncbi:MAG: DUF1569 domain-containing protein [bacterium]|nr:DUF1569 domain-containing protein [bacterium]
MKTIRDERRRAALVQRINALGPDATPRWGRVNVEQMLSHLVQAGELPFVASVPDKSTWAMRNVVKPLVLYVLPMPKEVKISAAMDQQKDGRKPLGFETDRSLVIELLNRLGTLPADEKCLKHPMFGKMSAKEWAVIAHKHMDHHLRQFGV